MKYFRFILSNVPFVWNFYLISFRHSVIASIITMLRNVQTKSMGGT